MPRSGRERRGPQNGSWPNGLREYAGRVREVAAPPSDAPQRPRTARKRATSTGISANCPGGITRGDTLRHRACRPMPKSKEAKARAAKALKEKRHRLKAELKVKAQVDAKGEVACEDCKKHIVAVISANLHIDRLKHVLEMQEDAQVPLSCVYGYRGGLGRRGVAQDTIGDNDLDIRARVRRYQLILSRCAAGFVPKSAIWKMGRCGSTEKRPIWRTKTNRDAMRLGDPRWHTKWLGPIRGR